VPVERTDAHRLVEECMISANVSAARFLKKHKLPTLFRLHDQPPAEKIDDLRDFLSGVGLTLEGGDAPTPVHYSAVLRAAADRPDKQLIETVVLRSLSQAVYGPSLSGHFGLALDDYAHFTSPIRRYPDLLVHRGIRHLLRKGRASDFAYSHLEMETLGEHCSMTERRADDATRDAIAWLKAEYMEDKVGEVFDGVVSGVTGFGLFVEIVDVFIDGLVHVTSLDNDFYHFDPIRHRLTGERGGRVFRIGDRLRVQVIRVSLDDRKIDLRLFDEEPQARAAKPHGKPAGAAKKAADASPRRGSRRRRPRGDEARTDHGTEGSVPKPRTLEAKRPVEAAASTPSDAGARPPRRRNRSVETSDDVAAAPASPDRAARTEAEPAAAAGAEPVAPDAQSPRRRRRRAQPEGEVAMLIRPSERSKTGDDPAEPTVPPDSGAREMGGEGPGRKRSSRRRRRDS